MAAQAGDLLAAERTGIVGGITVGDILLLSGTVEEDDQLRSEITSTAVAFVNGLDAKLIASGGVEGGNAAKTDLFVLNTNDGKAQIASLEDGNELTVYLTGDDALNGIVQERVFLKKGEIYVFENVQNGSVIRSSKGAYGYSGQLTGGNESPMPLGCLAFSFTDTFFYAFRNSTDTASSQGLVYIANGPAPSVVTFTDGAGAVVDGQADVSLAPYGYHIFHTLGNNEYRIKSSNPVVAGVNAQMSASDGSAGSFYDSRLVMPLTTDGITWPRSGFMSALYASTQVEYFVNDGATGFMNDPSGISPGTPIDLDAAAPIGSGANDADYEPRGATRFIAAGLVSAYSGADSAGLEATPMWPVNAAVQRAALPLFIRNSGDGGNNGIALASPYEGTAKIYEWDPVTETASVVYTVALTRTMTTTTRDDQNHPSSALISPNAAESTVQMTGDFYGGYVEADVPFVCVFNSEQNRAGATTELRKGTSGASVVAISADDDEQSTTGITPDHLRCEIRADVSGILRKRNIDASGVETWVVA